MQIWMIILIRASLQTTPLIIVFILSSDFFFDDKNMDDHRFNFLLCSEEGLCVRSTLPCVVGRMNVLLNLHVLFICIDFSFLNVTNVFSDEVLLICLCCVSQPHVFTLSRLTAVEMYFCPNVAIRRHRYSKTPRAALKNPSVFFHFGSLCNEM